MCAGKCTPRRLEGAPDNSTNNGTAQFSGGDSNNSTYNDPDTENCTFPLVPTPSGECGFPALGCATGFHFDGVVCVQDGAGNSTSNSGGCDFPLVPTPSGECGFPALGCATGFHFDGVV
ncbi:MAG: hypothetical protein P4L40_08005, partial [Terracidiphilus sp.]|nr:hypothetical protein [Terracidiphilus sp.]